ncbi:MAG: CinA family protein [Chloroflexi bacterium]|nr:CinA family protein [Chloroflexota bacterium]
MGELLLEARVGELLRARAWTISAAESCTGGLLLHRLTNVAGSSAYVLGGLVAYGNIIKENVLGVQRSTLIAYGAVSEQTAQAMANAARAMFGSDLALSVTGIAGPGGGSAEKPVGLTYVGLAGPEGLLIVRQHVWPFDRQGNKNASAEAALRLVLEAYASLP